MELEKRAFYIELFDCYGSLLTAKQANYFKAYYFDDYSFAEIAENYQVSRNAVFDQIKNTIQLLEMYEENLHLLKKKSALFALDVDEQTKAEIAKIMEE